MIFNTYVQSFDIEGNEIILQTAEIKGKEQKD
jgi:hypothetical protein